MPTLKTFKLTSLPKNQTSNSVPKTATYAPQTPAIKLNPNTTPADTPMTPQNNVSQPTKHSIRPPMET